MKQDRPAPPSSIVKRSVVISGHKTSVSLEDPFWHHVKRLAAAAGVSVGDFIGQADTGRRTKNLSCTLRLLVVEDLERRLAALDVGPAAAS